MDYEALFTGTADDLIDAAYRLAAQASMTSVDIYPLYAAALALLDEDTAASRIDLVAQIADVRYALNYWRSRYFHRWPPEFWHVRLIKKGT